jgi:hypothetical protein
MASQLFNAVTRNVARRGWLELFEQQIDRDTDRQRVANQHNHATNRTSLRHDALYQHEPNTQAPPARPSTKTPLGHVNSIGIALAQYRLKHAEQAP